MKIEVDTTEAVKEVKKLREEVELLNQALEKTNELIKKCGNEKHFTVVVESRDNIALMCIGEDFASTIKFDAKGWEAKMQMLK